MKSFREFMNEGYQTTRYAFDDNDERSLRNTILMAVLDGSQSYKDRLEYYMDKLSRKDFEDAFNLQVKIYEDDFKFLKGEDLTLEKKNLETFKKFYNEKVKPYLKEKPSKVNESKDVEAIKEIDDLIVKLKEQILSTDIGDESKEIKTICDKLLNLVNNIKSNY